MIDISGLEPADQRQIIEYMIDLYTEHLKLLVSAKSTGYFVDEIDEEIEYCRSVLDWFDSLKE